MKALVTGASGFIGRVLVEALLARGYQVRGFVRRTSRIEPLEQLGVDLCQGDLRDRDSVCRAAQGVDVVFHTAAKADHWGPRKAYEEANIQGTRHVMEAAVAARVARVIHFSSLVVYGRQTGLLTESTALQKIGDRYVDSKIEGEELAWDLARKHGLAFTVVRPTSIYGPHDPKWIPMVVENIRQGRMRVVGSGKNLAPIVFGDDVAECAIQAAESKAAVGETFNVSSGERITWQDFFTTLAQCLGTTLPKVHIPVPILYPAAAVMEVLWKLAGAQHPPPATRFGVRLLAADWWVDISKAENLLGFRPRVFLKEGLQKTLAWMQEELHSYRPLSKDSRA